MKRICLAMLAFVAASALAQPSQYKAFATAQVDDPRELSISECTAVNVLAAEKRKMAHVEIESASERLRQLDAIKQIVSRAKNDGRSALQSLSTRDVRALQDLRSRYAAGLANDVVDSDHDRDSDAIGKLLIIADRMYRDDDYSAAGAEDKLLYDVLLFERGQAQKNNWNKDAPISTDVHCSLGYALNKLGETALLSIDQQKLNDGSAELAALQAKYGLRSPSPRSMSDEDSARYKKIAAEMQPALRAGEYYHDLMIINALADAANLKYLVMKSDLAKNGGHYESAGDTLDKMQLSARQLDALKVLHIIGEKIPSDLLKDMSKVSPDKE